MRPLALLLAILSLLLALPSVAGADPSYMQWPTLQGAGKKRPAFSFTAPSAGDYATLTATTGQALSITRASTKTVQTSATALMSVASGHFAVDYRGLSIEAAATNLLAAPSDLSSASWTKQHTPTIVVDQCVFPDGTTSMDKITGSDAVSVAFQSKASPGSGTFTLSGWTSTSTAGPGLDLERSGGSILSPCTCTTESPYGCTTPGTTTTDCAMHLSGVVSSTPARVSVTATSATALTSLLGIVGPGLYNDASNSGASACWGGLQMEAGAFATSYVNGSRAADVVDVGAVTLNTHPSFSATVNLEGLPASGTATALDLTDGTNSWKLAILPSGSAICSYGTNSDTTTAYVSAKAASLVQCSYDGAAIHTCINGSCHSTAAAISPVTSFTHSYLGSDGAANFINAFVSTACAGKDATCPAGTPPSGSVATSGLVYWYDATNVDGLNNSTITNFSPVATWTNLGSGANGTAAVASQPIYEANILNGNGVMNFGGDQQTFDVGAGGSFIHQTGVFDAFFIVQSNRFIGNAPIFDDGTFNAGATGAALVTDATGHLVFKIDSAGTVTTTDVSSWTIPMFSWVIVEVVGDGSMVGLSNDLVTYQYAPFGALPAAAATTDLFLGGIGGGTTFGWDGNIQEALIYNRKLSPTERAALKGWLRARSGL